MRVYADRTAASMNSTSVMWLLLAFYAVIMLLAANERNWFRAMYFCGAIIISLAVMGMTTEE